MTEKFCFVSLPNSPDLLVSLLAFEWEARKTTGGGWVPPPMRLPA